LLIDANSVLRADGTGATADGGMIIAWSDGTTTFDGQISVRGANAGDGGFVETSGAYLGLGGRVDVASALGDSGTWLIDPVNVTVDALLIASILPTLEAGGNITVTTNNPGGDAGDISLVSALTVDFAANASADNEATITAFANNNITTSAAITALNGVLNLNATALSGVTIGGAINTNGGDVTISADNVAINDTVNAGAGIVTIANESAGREITLGTEVGGTLSLTDAEVDNVTADILRIGSSTAGSISITDTISPAGTDTLSLITGDKILDANDITNVDVEVANLALRAVNGIADNERLDTDIDTLAALNTADNSISIVESLAGGSLTIGAVDGLTGVVNQGSGPHPGQISIQIETDDGDLTVAAGSVVTSSSGGIYLVAQHENGGAGDRLFTNNGVITMQGGNGEIEIVANNMDLGSVAGGSSISSLNGARIVLSDDPASSSTIAIQIGDGAADGVNTLGLSNDELGTVSTLGTLQIGHAGSGAVTAGNIDLADIGAIEINTASDATFNGTIDGPFDLTVNAAGTTTFNGAIGGTTALSGLTTDAAGTTTIGAGTIDVDGNTTTFNDTLTLTANLEINDTGDVYFSDIIGGFFDLTVNSGGTVTFSKGAFVPGLSVLNNLTVDAPQIAIWEDVVTAFDTNLSGAITLDTVEADRWVTFAPQNITLTGSLDGDVHVFMFPRNDAFLNGTIGTIDPLKSLTVNSAPVPGVDPHIVYLGGGPIVAQTGMMLGHVTELTADTVVTVLNTGGTVSVSEVAGPYQLTINTPGTTLIGGAGPLVHFNGATPADPLTGLTVTGGGTIQLTHAFGGYFRVNGNVSFGGPVQLQTDIAMDAAGNVNFFNTIDSGSNGVKYLTVSTPGQIYIGELVGASSALDYLTLSGSRIAIGDSIETLHAQTYNGPTVLNGAIIFTATDAGGDISFSSTVDSLDTNQFLKANAAGDITFGGKVGGTKLVSLLEATAGGTIFVNGGLVATKGSQTYNDLVSVAGTVFASTTGSLNFNAGATTTLPDNDVWFLAADDIRFGGSAQWAGSGNMMLVAGWNAATDGSTGWTLGNDFADTPTLMTAGNYGLGTGDISIGTAAQTTGISVGSRDGTTTALAQNMYLASSASDDGYAQLGFRGAATGDIDVMLTEDLTTLTGAGLRSFVQIGHGGHNDDNDHAGDISIDVGEGVLLSGGSNTEAYALFGHGGYGSDGNNSGAIDLNVGGILTVIGGAGTNAFAQIGHGDISGTASGTRMGDISAIVGGRTNFTANAGGYWFGHATSTGGGISNADVALVTNGLSFAGLTLPGGPTAASGDFAQMIRNNLTGGDVLIANWLAQIADADTDDPDLTDDILHFGVDFSDEVTTDHNLTFAATGEISFTHGLQMDGSGNINLIAGWDGATGLDLAAFPMLDVAAIEAAGAFGSSTGANGDNGDVNIGEGLQTGNVRVGTRLGDVHVLAHDLEVKGSDDQDFSRARLGYMSGGSAVDSDIRIVVIDDVIVQGGSEEGSSAAIGHSINDSSGNLAGDITILGESDANDNEVIVAGGDGDGATAQIGHDGSGGTVTGNISITGEDVYVGFNRGSFPGGDDAYSQIGHRGDFDTDTASGNIMIDASGQLVVTGGDGTFTRGVIGHVARSTVGDIELTVGDSLFVDGGDNDDAEGQVGHSFNVSASGAITALVTDDVFVRGGFDNFTSGYIGHFGYGDITGPIQVTAGGDVNVFGGSSEDAEGQIGHASVGGTVSSDIGVSATGFVTVLGGDGSYAMIGHGYTDTSFVSTGGDVTVTSGETVSVIGGTDLGSDARIGHGGNFTGGALGGNISVEAADNVLVFAGIGDYSTAQIGHGGYSQSGSRTGDITVTSNGGGSVLGVGGIGILSVAGGIGSTAVIGHGGSLSIGATSGDISVAANGPADFAQIFIAGGFNTGNAAQIGHGGPGAAGTYSGDIGVTADGALSMLGGSGVHAYAQIGHGDSGRFSNSSGLMGDISVIIGGEASLQDGGSAGQEAWIGHRTSSGTVSNADVFLQAFGFDRDSGSTLAAGDLGRFNKDILEADIPSGNFTLIATGTGLLVEDPVYNSPFQVLMSVNNDLVLDTNAIFVNSGTGDIILAAGGDFHNDTGSLTPITTGGRWLVYSTRPDNNRNDIEITNWDFLRYATTFDINNPLIGAGDGLIYSVTPVVNFSVSSHTINYGETFSPTIAQTLTVNGIQVDPNAFGLGINPATAQWAYAPFVVIDAGGNPVSGSYPGGLTTTNEFLPYFGMSFVTIPGDLTVAGSSTPADTSPDLPTVASLGLGGMCAYRSDDEDPDEDGPSYDRIIELCGIIESDRD
jgi:hypothetical protein